MANSTLISDYIQHGVAASRPTTPLVGTGCLALYFATDTAILSGWSGSAWVTLTTGATQWNAGSVTALATGLAISGGSLTPNWQAASVTSVGTGLTIVAGVLETTASASEWSAGTVTALGLGLNINSGTIAASSVYTLTGTAGGTVTITGTALANDAQLNMPASGGTVTAAASPTAFLPVRIHIKQGATAGVLVLNGGFVFGTSGGPTSFTITPTAGAIDMLGVISQDGTHYRAVALDQGLIA